MKKSNIKQLFTIFRQAKPEPQGELTHINNYTMLVSVVLSAQATDKSVNLATTPLFKKVKTPQEMLKLGEEKLIQHIKSIGLFRNKAKNIISLSQQLIEKHDSIVPNDEKELMALAGVGKKSANVVLNMAFGKATIAVDTHVMRVSNRLGLVESKNPDKISDILCEIIPTEFKLHAHHWLILHGRYTCMARKPKCYECPVSQLCPYPEKTAD